jgi:hypothetical protein
MTEALTFEPPRRRGRSVLGLLFPLPALLAAFALFQAIQLPPGTASSSYLLISIALAALVPWLGYRLYALYRSGYTLERERMRIQWGLRIEEIPMADILWARLAAEVEHNPPLPRLRLPGAVLGTRRSSDLGRVEYLASESLGLVLVAVPGQVFAISPEDPGAFLDAFQALVEMGSFVATPALSLHPASLLRRVWEDRPARILGLASLILGLGLVGWVAALAPSTAEFPVGFLGPGAPRPPTSPVRLILLPAASTAFILIDWTLGAILYRQEDTRPLAYLLWISAVLTPALFLAAVYWITRMG